MHVGPNGTSGALKLANNQLVALMSAAWGESIASAQAGGVDPAVALEMFAGTFARIATTKWRTILERDFTPKFTLDALYKDIGQALRSAQTAALALPLLEAVEPVYARAVAGGAGPRDFSIVVDLVANGSRRAEAAP